ncbi:MAG TPA: MFS transporter [Candidatus Limnocylindria bacterium]|nr:MFS transporter [Candidatus Limnocylindria bacterium]
MTGSTPRPALWPAYLATFTFMLGGWATSIAVPLNVVLLGGSLAEAGVLAAIRFGLQAFLQLPFGAVIDAWGTRRVLFIATAGNALVNVVPVLAVVTGSILPLYAWAVLSGVSASLFLPSTSAYIAASAEPRTRGSAFGWLTLFTHTGVASGPAVGGVLWDLAGPAPTYVVAGLLGAIAVVAPFFVPAVVPQRVRLTRLPGMVAEVARQRAIVGSWVAALAIGLPWGAVSGLFPLFGTGIGLTAGTVGLLMASQSVANGASRVPLGRTIDRLPIPPIVAALTAAGYGVVIGLLGLQGNVVLILVVLVAGIVMLAFTLMLVQVTISEVARPEVRATGLGGYGTALSAGLGLGPALGGAIADAAGFGWAFATIGVAGVAVAAVAALVLIGTRRRPAVVVFDA